VFTFGRAGANQIFASPKFLMKKSKLKKEGDLSNINAVTYMGVTVDRVWIGE
jgi:hypothetical protein